MPLFITCLNIPPAQAFLPIISNQKKINFPNNLLPLSMGEGEGGRRLREPLARRGVDKIETIWSPLPFIPSRGGEGGFY